MVDDGYTITDNGDIIEPVVETTTIPTETESVETVTNKAEVTSTSATTTATTSEPVESETTNSTTASVPEDEGENKSVFPIVGGGVGVVALGGIVVAALSKKKK